MLWIGVEGGLMDSMIVKGSVAVDGVSLTIGEVREGRLGVSLIPTTLEKTNLGRRKVGDRVNLEADIMGKWVRKQVEQMLGGEAGGKLTSEKLREQGFF